MSLNLPGVPQLPPSSATPLVATIASAAISSTLWQASQAPPQWGVFDSDGNLVLSPDSVIDFTNRQEYEISTFPVQEGEFASYNKVIKPYEVYIRISKSGTLNDRTELLLALDNLVASTDLYTVATPEQNYDGVNLVRYEIARRGPKGAYFLTEVDLYFEYVIEVTPQYTGTAVQLPNSQSAAAQPTSNVGNVNPGTPSTQLSNVGTSALASIPAPQFF